MVRKQPRSNPQHTEPAPTKQQIKEAQKQTEDDPAVERGEGIAAGKFIAGGGKKADNEPGASEQKAKSAKRPQQ